ncbi:hypothetical protein [Trinickia sp. EG282A]|uniref:hypothetical protein n=1 Tax=Trinickia sp. EG282A TaxID=3237013 RepID=UPI0034D27451
MNDKDREQAKRLSALAKEQGLTYTGADIKNQQALMNSKPNKDWSLNLTEPLL